MNDPLQCLLKGHEDRTENFKKCYKGLNLDVHKTVAAVYRYS